MNTDSNWYFTSDIIYGDTEGRSFKSVFNDLALLQKLMRWNERDWLELFEE